MIHKTYKYRLYPSRAQSALLEKHFGCVRFVYNWALSEKLDFYQETGKQLSKYDLQKRLPLLKSKNEWLYEINSQSLQSAVINLDRAFLNFFKKHSCLPKFKKKGGWQSFQVPQFRRIDQVKNTVYIPKFTEGIKCKVSRRFEGKAKTFTISKSGTGKYFVSVLVELPIDIPKKPLPAQSNTIGIDVGIKLLCTTSEGEKIENPKHFKRELARLNVLQRRSNKKRKDSNNRKKAMLKVARLYEKISNRRNDFLHKLTHRLTSENQVVSLAVEDLNIAGMMKNRRLARSIADVSWSELFRQLEYKCKWRGKNLLKIGRFEPSSRMCSCGEINKGLKLSDRNWTCNVCGTTHDRDILAAQNIKRFALTTKNLTYSGAGCPGEPAETRCCNGGL